MSTVETAARAIRERDEARAVASAMLAALESLVDVCQYATFDNGVEHNGMKEADYWAGEALDTAKTAIASAEAAGIKVEP